jgi:type I restriction enzyme S subunit
MNPVNETPQIPVSGKWKRYPSYKQSGVEWLGEVPEGWKIAKLKFLTSRPLKYGANETTELEDRDLPRYIRITDIQSDGTLNNETFKSLPEKIAFEYLLNADDLLLARSGATVGKSFIFDESWGKCCFAGYLVQARPDKSKVIAKYLYYFTNSSNYWAWISSINIQSTIQNVSGDKYANLSISIPSLPEQSSIATFLDRETASIDALIEKKERLIALLEEKRAALISHAVTKGLDPDAKMKDSGVEWIGMVPEGWGLQKMKWISPQITVGIVITPSKYYVDEGIPCLRSLNIKENRISSEELVYISEESNQLHKKSQIFSGDLVSVRTGQTGTTAVVDNRFDGCNCIDLIIIKKSHGFDSEYISYVLNSDLAKTKYALESSGSIQSHFNIETAANMVIPLPPLNEQKMIRQFLERNSRNTTNSIALIDKSAL